MNFIKTVKDCCDGEGLIKTTYRPVATLSAEQKAVLNRKANVMFNSGNITDAGRIFITTGYSDGLTRTGDYYIEKNMSLKALRMYLLAHNRRKAEPILEDIASVISSVLKEDN